MRKRGRGGRYGASGPRRGPTSVSAEAMDTFLAGAMSGFSMRDEARNTTRDHLKWDRDERLRYRPVVFVSAGFIEPLKEFQVTPDDAKPDERVVGEVQQEDSSERPALASLPSASNSATPDVTEGLQPKQVEPIVPEAFFIDTAGDEALRVKSRMAVPVPERSVPGPDDSDSSDEVILFKGRRAAAKGVQPSSITVHHTRRELEMTERRLQAEPEAHVVTQVEAETQSVTQVEAALEQSTMEGPLLQPVEPTSKDTAEASRCRDKDERANEVGSDSDDPLSDYIKNMDGIEDLIADHQSLRVRDLGGSNDEFGADDQADSDGSEGADSDGLDDDAAFATGDPSAVASEEEEWAADLDDEQLARLLAKQESLGLGSNELVLFDDAVAPKNNTTRRKPVLATKKTSKRQPDSAKAVAEAFEDLDLVMDWDRVNPPPRKSKGKYGAAKFDIADDELRATMEASYEKDRLKKTERKKEREALRAKGMLGKNANPNDPRVKYPDGINLAELEEELREFLLGSDQILSLPPMDASARKIVHEVANRLKIKSKSSGSGDQRRPVLHRTKNTPSYNEAVLSQIMTRIHRRTFPRLGKQQRSGAGGDRTGYAALKYRDGEVVGGSAPELGETNKGRAMLEKMGWTKGTGLGALDNKGILEPVAHIVKISKAGLG